MEKASESKTDGETEGKFSARPYQVELLERAKERNTIVCLGTGTGKTFISVMLIKELAHEVRGNYKDGGRRTFFLVNTGTFICFVFMRSALPRGSGYDISARVGPGLRRWVVAVLAYVQIQFNGNRRNDRRSFLISA